MPYHVKPAYQNRKLRGFLTRKDVVGTEKNSHDLSPRLKFSDISHVAYCAICGNGMFKDGRELCISCMKES